MIGLVLIFTTIPIGLTFSQRASFLISFTPVSLHAVYLYVCIFTYVSEMIVCHAIYSCVSSRAGIFTIVAQGNVCTASPKNLGEASKSGYELFLEIRSWVSC